MSKNITEFLAEIEELMANAPKALSDYPMVELGVSAKLKLIHGQLAFLTGSAVSVIKPETFKPITSFMGSDLKSAQPIQVEDLSAKELEKKIFLEKGDRLKANIHTLSDEAILDSHKTDVDKKVIRLVAKWAGLENFKTAELNGEFLADIRMALKEQEAHALKVKTDKDATDNK